MKVSELIDHLKSLPGDLPVEIEPCEPVCLQGGPVGGVWVEDGDNGEPAAVISRVGPEATQP